MESSLQTSLILHKTRTFYKSRTSPATCRSPSRNFWAAAGALWSTGCGGRSSKPLPALLHLLVLAGDDEGQVGSGNVPHDQVLLPPPLVRHPPHEARLLQRPRRERDLIHRLKRVVAQRDLLEVVALAVDDLRHRVRPPAAPPVWPRRPPTAPERSAQGTASPGRAEPPQSRAGSQSR